MTEFAALRRQYRELLLDGIVPLSFRFGIDWEHGGVLSCLREDRSVASEDKFTWSQARSAWTFSALYNRIETRPEFLCAAENSVRCIMRHFLRPQRKVVLEFLSREYRVLPPPAGHW